MAGMRRMGMNTMSINPCSLDEAQRNPGLCRASPDSGPMRACIRATTLQ